MKKDSFQVHCRSCGESHPFVIQTEDGFLDYEYDFKTRRFTLVETRVNEDSAPEYRCWRCRRPLDDRMAEEIHSAING